MTSLCPPEELGNVKLHKILYFSDMFQFLKMGHPITGEQYLKQKFGPVARHLTATVNALVDDGLLRAEEVEYFGKSKKNYIALKPFDRKHLSKDDLEMLENVCDFVRGKSAKEISEISHNRAWELAELGEEIPYFTALQFVPDEMTETDIAWANETALNHASSPPF